MAPRNDQSSAALQMIISVSAGRSGPRQQGSAGLHPVPVSTVPPRPPACNSLGEGKWGPGAVRFYSSSKMAGLVVGSWVNLNLSTPIQG